MIIFAVLLGIALVWGEPIQPVENETFKQKLYRLSHTIEDNPEYKRQFMQRVHDAKNLTLPPIDWKCSIDLSPEVPTSVHRLRPGDIKVMSAFGDSISAGNGLGAQTAPGVALENRGEVFTIGGDETLDAGIITLTNFVRKFNPDVKGYSHCPSTRDNLVRSWLNVAEPGGDNRDMPLQARDLVNRMLDDERIDYDNDWKLVSLFVGGNDLCGSCRGDAMSPENYGKSFREAMDILYNEVPRTFVQLIVMFDITPLTNFSTGALCDYLQINFCECAVNTTTRAQLRGTQLAYYDQLMSIQEDPVYQGRDDFTIVVQPHMRDMEPPRDPDTGEYLSGFLAPDCFHPNRVAHQTFAFYLWNALLTPVGQKPLTSDTTPIPDVPMVPYCPTEHNPYIFTRLNSDVVWP